MKIDFSLEKAVKDRCSVRNYKEEEMKSSEMKSIEAFINSLDNPFGKKVNFHYLDSRDMANEKTLGTRL